MTGSKAIAIARDPLFDKSKAYMQRAIGAKADSNNDQYQLWASLALELLGKARLAAIHPCLVVDPTHQVSLFAAAGHSIGTDIKTIAAHTLYDRLKHVSIGFDEKIRKFCEAISQRRNAELHSGEVPFQAMRLDAWEASFWRAAQVILESMASSLEEWLGADEAKAPMKIIKHARDAAVAAALQRLKHAREDFLGRPKKERDTVLAQAEVKEAYHYRVLFKVDLDHEWESRCPACGGKAFLTGVLVSEETTETDDPYEWEEWVEQQYSAEEFHCPVCELKLYSLDEIVAAKLEPKLTIKEQREREYEPEYGND